MLLTLGVVALSAWRVSRMTVAAAIRDLPEPLAPRRRRRLVLAVCTVGAGALMAVSGAAAASATPPMLGVSIVLIGLVPLACVAGVGACGLHVGGAAHRRPLAASVDRLGGGVRPLKMNFSTWIVSGLMVDLGAVWTIMYNAPLLLAGAARVLGRSRALAPVQRMAMAYPLAARFRSG